MIERIEHLLDELLHPSRFPTGILTEAGRYAALGGGKRVRPQLLIAVATVSGHTPEPALIPACAVELIHTYSLIHDDLPCMDDDDMRRGRPSLHRVVTEGQALLTGNFLLTYAFELLSTAPHLSAEQKLKLIQTLSHRLGAWGMMGGQELDLRWSSTPLSEENLRDLHLRKTGALIQACVECGIIICPSSHEHRLQSLGLLLGQLFQLLDDLQDPKDLIEGRPTALAVWGVEKSQAIAQHLYENIVELALPFQGTSLEKLLSLWNPAYLELQL